MPTLPSNRKVRVLVVDDSILARTMISKGLSTSPQIEVVATAFNAKDAMAKVEQFKPDVITSDVEMPGMSGIDFLKQLLPIHPIPVILVSSLDLRVFDALSAGAVDFVRWKSLIASGARPSICIRSIASPIASLRSIFFLIFKSSLFL